MLGPKARKMTQQVNDRLTTGFTAAGRMAHKAAEPLMAKAVDQAHVRVRALITNEENELLLVRNWFSHQRWSLPGGGIKRLESPAEAAARETYEETGIRLAADQLQQMGSFINQSSKAAFTILCFGVEVAKRPATIAKRRRLEMLDVAWFPLDHLPRDLSPTVRQALQLAKHSRQA